MESEIFEKIYNLNREIKSSRKQKDKIIAAYLKKENKTILILNDLYMRW